MRNYKIADISRSARYTVTTTDHDDGHAEMREMTGADLIAFTNAAAHLYDIHAEEITAEPQPAAADILREAVKLDHRVSVYVPGTQGTATATDNRQQVERVAAELSAMFGGATATATGYWMSESAGLVAESTTIVYAACTAEQLDDHLAAVVEIARQIKQEMQQEAVSIEIDGTLYII